MKPSRRDLMGVLAAMGGTAALPPSIARAVSLPASGRTGSIRDIEHVVILMQENRSFDHYFGTLRGVRGFGDPAALRLRSGDSVFRQPNPAGGTVLPFHLDTATTAAPVIKSLDHSWKGSHAEWANHDVWVKHKTAMTMGHFTRADIPFYHALADAFTIGDNYFCSIHGPTNPNRLFLFSGTSGTAVGADGRQCIENVDDGNWTGDKTLDKAAFPGWGWTTYAERLGKAGVSWKLYQEHDNYGDNPLASFANFRGDAADPRLVACGRDIVAGSTADNAKATTAQHLIDAVARDAAAGTLPQVSWIVAPFEYCEHPEAAPQYGESLVSRLIDALTADPAVWAKTALILNYDENDGFFDHIPAPIPATAPHWGASTVSTEGETWGGEPIGLGVRVPLIIVSPWTRGGFVCSQLFDHTSVIRFLEARFGVAEPNITPWRRAVTGDLTAMFDFSGSAPAPTGLPGTTGYLATVSAAAGRPMPTVPADQATPRQEAGQRPARPLPYALAVQETAPADHEGLHLLFDNHGTAGAVFQVYASQGGPWYYTVEAGKRLPATLTVVGPDGRYDVAIHGPNGFRRTLRGTVGAAPLIVARTEGERIELTITNPSNAPMSLAVNDLAIRIPSGGREVRRIATMDRWYDVTVNADNAVRHFAGHIETGQPSRSDPAIGQSA
ncbi:phosphocholine-specific phospholipase C [Sphingomonas oryzagri]|uniref:phospholipase C n=1 Tax=Sphingomonas oryzagri TaxID=3042314 RepID=A0ABT6MX34_9SPHN|nr:phospholipase C, phosphocholine-specific [Sphingomonas oryzagri]MDH7637382.1 phospholipase C, phosphocholine-specific [Sphingomonas oryzagri]